MQKDFLSNLSFAVILNLLIKAFYVLVIEYGVQDRLGSESWGVFFNITSFTLILQVINDFGLQNYNNTLVAKHSSLIKRLFPNIISLKIILSVVYLASTLLIGYFYHFKGSAFLLLIIVALTQVISSFNLFLRSNLTALGRYKKDSVLSIFDRLLLVAILLSIFFIPFLPKLDIYHFALYQVVCVLATALLGLYFLRDEIAGISLRFKKSHLLFILKKSMPYALMLLLTSLYTRMDAILLPRLIADGNYETGVYGAGFRLLDMCNMFAFLFAGLLLPMFSKSIHTGQPVRPLLRIGYQLMWVYTWTAVTVSIAFRNEIMALLLPRIGDAYHADTMAMLMVNLLSFGVVYVYGTLLVALGENRRLNLLFALATVCNIALNLILIPRYKAIGACMASVATQLIVAVTEVFLVHCRREFKISTRQIIKFLLYSILVITSIYAISTYVPANWLLKIALCSLLSIIAAFFFRLISIPEFKSLIRSGR